MIYLIYLITGFLAGVIGGILGTGGCALIMPVIRFVFHFDPAVAVGTALTAVVFSAALGAYQHFKMKNVDKATALLTCYAGILGVIIGSIVFGYIKHYGNLIDLIIGIAFIIVSVRYWHFNWHYRSWRWLCFSPFLHLFFESTSKARNWYFNGCFCLDGLGGCFL